MPPRRGVHRPAAAAAGGAPTPDGAAPPRLHATVQAWWAWLRENMAVSSVLVALMVIVAAVVLQPSEATLVTRALSSRTLLAEPSIAPYVERREMALIVDTVERGMDYIVVDGGNRVGKSVAVKVAMARLSAARTVRWSVCNKKDTAASVLRRLFGLDASTTWLSRTFASVAKLSQPVPPSVADIQGLVLSTTAPGRLEPVLVVEMAERLEVEELKSLLDFAKELNDEHLGRFIFVFSPTGKLYTIGDFGSVSRAKVVHVGDLSETEAAAFLTKSGCAADRASALYALIGGHLPHLVTDTVHAYCRGTLTLADVEGELLADIGAQMDDIDRVLGAGSACRGLCGVETKVWPTPEVLDVLLKKHLVVAALRRGVHLGSQLVRAVAIARCSCKQ